MIASEKGRKSTRLGELLRLYRVMRGLDLRSLGAEIGISAPTLMRIEHGRALDAATFVKILAWLTKSGPSTVRLDAWRSR